MQKSKIIIFIIGFVSAFFPAASFAAILYLEPSTCQYHQGDIFIVEARLNTEGEQINTVELDLMFSANLEFVDFSKGDSILTLWIKEPSIIDGTLSFSGGVPGGFNGDGRIGRIIFRGKGGGEAILNFKEDSKVLLNNGLGTLAKLKMKGATVAILTEGLKVPKDEWREELEKDKIPPEPFKIEVNQNPTIFGGKYFISFSTIDKQTGIDHYEVKEGKGEWKKVNSPYPLEDQSLNKKIIVRAYDKAGNYRESEINPTHKINWKDLLAIIIVLIGVGLILWILRKIKK